MAAATPEEMALWPAPNFEDPEVRGHIVIGMAAPTVALVVVIAAMRFYGRGVLRHALGMDDYMMFAAAVRLAHLQFDAHSKCLTAHCLLLPATALAKYGYGLMTDNQQMFSIPVTAIAIVSLNLGLGLHMWDQKKEWHTPYSKVCSRLIFFITTRLS
jgi:hypothetical protein